jgi:acetyl/propionyl-CoA carboxylase alpha subunit
MTYDVTIDEKHYRLELGHKDGEWFCHLDGREVHVDPVLLRHDVLSLIIGGVSYEIKRELSGFDMYLWIGGARYRTELHDPRSLHSRRAESGGAEGKKKVTAPMPGKVVRVLVKEKMEVQAGQGVVVVEAMKMQNELKSPKQGIVQKVMVAEGANVKAGDVLLVVE